MVEQVLSWIVSIIIMVDISYIIYFITVQAVAKIKCHKKRYCKPLNACHESGCRYAEYCEHYEYVYTKEEMASIKKLAEEVRRRQQ